MVLQRGQKSNDERLLRRAASAFGQPSLTPRQRLPRAAGTSASIVTPIRAKTGSDSPSGKREKREKQAGQQGVYYTLCVATKFSTTST